MSTLKRVMTPLAVAGAAGLLSLAVVPAASAAAPSDSGTTTTTYKATLNPVPLNTPKGAASGNVTIKIKGDQATVTENVKGLATKIPTDKDTLKAVGIPAKFAGAAFPHVQHVHINGAEKCPAASADANGDGVISTVEGQDAYGKIGTTLSTKGKTDGSTALDITKAPGGGSFTYSRTFTMNSDTLDAIQNGKAAVVVHGLNPATAPKASLSTANSLGLTLPGADKKVALIATAPALCGVLSQSSQMSTTPVGASPTGGGSTAGVEDGWLFGVGGALIVAAAGVFMARRRFGTQN